MRNQKGEVVTGVMVVMMVAMMIFGGMHFMHRDHGDHGESRGAGEDMHLDHGHDHQKGHQHEHRGDAGKTPESGAEEQR